MRCQDNMKPPVLGEVLSSLVPLRAEFSASVSRQHNLLADWHVYIGGTYGRNYRRYG